MDIVSGTDLAHSGSVDEIIDGICKGFVRGVCSGPPCETWPSARHNQDKPGPLPIRSHERPWGELKLSAKLMRQGIMANVLMCHNLLILIFCLATGTPFLMEHPAITALHAICHPKHKKPASIWNTDAILSLLCNPQVQLHQILLHHSAEELWSGRHEAHYTVRCTRAPHGRHSRWQQR